MSFIKVFLGSPRRLPVPEWRERKRAHDGETWCSPTEVFLLASVTAGTSQIQRLVVGRVTFLASAFDAPPVRTVAAVAFSPF
jgi:hypothetical protein